MRGRICAGNCANKAGTIPDAVKETKLGSVLRESTVIQTENWQTVNVSFGRNMRYEQKADLFAALNPPTLPLDRGKLKMKTPFAIKCERERLANTRRYEIRIALCARIRSEIEGCTDVDLNLVKGVAYAWVPGLRSQSIGSFKYYPKLNQTEITVQLSPETIAELR